MKVDRIIKNIIKYTYHISTLHLSVILEWQGQFQMVSHKIHNLYVNKDFVIFLTSKLITFFIDGFTSCINSESMAYLLGRSAHIYGIWDLEGEVHWVWDL